MEFRYDGGRENVERLPQLLKAVGGCCLTALALWCFNCGMRVVGPRGAALLIVMLLSGPVLVSIYLANLMRHLQYKTLRLVLEPEAITIHLKGQVQRIERGEIDYVHHTGKMLEIRRRNADPIMLPAQFTDQDELLSRLT